ncbi:hypothetical protein C7S16_3779 [Burkholderia thailandensis]|uniref:Uncharacterized protein n=1 Tax=Burkholderia thailandensis TaxID=57975 RepID=A0AAW9CZ70_BURTH|nr:hypothetical protein [Burkholderia thailandensis]MDW9255930.1 hypothetical protein [Burkholderia thailandensis]
MSPYALDSDASACPDLRLTRALYPRRPAQSHFNNVEIRRPAPDGQLAV